MFEGNKFENNEAREEKAKILVYQNILEMEEQVESGK